MRKFVEEKKCNSYYFSTSFSCSARGIDITKRWARDKDREAYKVLLQKIEEIGVPKEFFFDKVRWI
jgi:hypothetical protein